MLESPVLAVPRVKICGIATREDALTALRCGADALGFLVGLRYETPDRLSLAEACRLISALPPFVTSVLVTHLPEVAEVVDLCGRAGVHAVQLHGDFPLDRVGELRASLPHLKIIKAVHSEDRSSLEQAVEAARVADAVLLDTRVGERIGGTGRTHDWALSRRIREELAESPVILAGGLTPDNVVAAIEAVEPFGVDVNSGVQGRPGRKDPERVRSFVSRAKQIGTEAARLSQTG